MTNNFNTCVIFAAGEYYGETPIVPADSFVIAADGGLDHARALDVMPDVVVGDFDSITGKRPTPDERTVAGKRRSGSVIRPQNRMVSRCEAFPYLRRARRANRPYDIQHPIDGIARQSWRHRFSTWQ